MGCCYCCLSEGEKVKKILENFTPQGVSTVEDGTLCLAVGRVVLAGSAPFYAPGSGKPCVYYHIRVEEEHVRMERDQDGRQQRRVWWETIVDREYSSDFYIQDGFTKCFVQGSDRSKVKIQSSSTGGSNWSNFGLQSIPQGVRYLIQQNRSGWSWSARSGTTGNFRYSEQAFDVNELVGAFGVIAPSNDPYTGEPVKFCTPFTTASMPESKMEGWEDHAKEAFQELAATATVLLSDSKQFTQAPGLNIMPIQLPPPIPVNWAAQYGIAQMAPMAQQPVMQQQPMMQGGMQQGGQQGNWQGQQGGQGGNWQGQQGGQGGNWQGQQGGQGGNWQGQQGGQGGNWQGQQGGQQGGNWQGQQGGNWQGQQV